MKNSQILLFLFLLTTSLVQSAGIQFEKISLEEAKTKAKKENKIIFIDYYADWCGPCKWLAKNVFTEAEVGSLFNSNFINLKINADQDDFIGQEYNANSLPTLLFIDSEGNLKKKVVGAVDKQTLINAANYVLHPETDPLTIKKKTFDAGNRSKEFLLDYALLLVESEKDFSGVVKAYRKEYPQAHLDDLTDFTFFFLEEISLNSEALLNAFKENFKTYYKDDERKGMALQKLVNIYVYKIEQDAEEKNEKSRDAHIEELVNFVEKFKIKEIDSDKISEAFIAYYEEKASE